MRIWIQVQYLSECGSDGAPDPQPCLSGFLYFANWSSIENVKSQFFFLFEYWKGAHRSDSDPDPILYFEIGSISF